MSTISPTRRTPPAGGINRVLLTLELRRMLRNRRTVIFTLVLPVALFLLFGSGSSYAHEQMGSGNVTAYIMISMATYGAALATVAGGAMVSVERATGWSRQLRLTPLTPTAYIAVKLIVSLALGAAAVLAVYAAGAITGRPEMALSVWVVSGLVAWVGSLVFAACGLFVGYLLPSENVMQVLGPLMAAFAFVGGLFTPLEDGSTLATLAQLTPMYGLAELTRAPLTGEQVQWVWVVNILAWLVVFAGGARWRFRRDTARV